MICIKMIHIKQSTKNPHALPSHYLCLQPLTTTIIVTIFKVLPSPECHIVGVPEYTDFSDWLLSAHNMDLSFLHVFSCPDSSFLFSTEWYSIFWWTAENGIYLLFIYSSAEGHRGCFQVGWLFECTKTGYSELSSLEWNAIKSH